MKGLVLCFIAISMLTAAQGEEEEQQGQLMDTAADEEDGDIMECFRCDLGFWDACYTTKTKCSHGQRCFTGRGKAADVLDVKTLGCAKIEECNTMSTVELFPNKTIFVMMKHCCDTPLCNSAHKLTTNSLLLCVTVVVLTTCNLIEASIGLQQTA